VPGALSTTAYGIWIDGATTAVAGGYTDAKGTHAYVRSLDGKHTMTFDIKGALVTHFEGITGWGGAGSYYVCGDYSDLKNGSVVYGFWLEIGNWKVLAPPVVIGKVSANSVLSHTVIGVYSDGGKESGYTVNVPIEDPPR